MWAKRLLQFKNSLSYAFLKKYLTKMTIENLLSLSMEPKEIFRTIPTFYMEILYHGYDVRKDPEEIQEILNEVIWFNKHIKIAGKYVL